MLDLETTRLLKLRWRAMHSRCTCVKSASFKNYGGRGIKVCKRWSVFENFLADMGASFDPKLQLDRINNDDNYCKSNCRWTTAKENLFNRRNSQKLSKKLRDSMAEMNVSPELYRQRVKYRGWSHKKASTTPNFNR